MRKAIRILPVIAVLLVAQLACNLPTQPGTTTQIPAPNQTLTALFAVTPGETTATPPAGSTATPGGDNNANPTTAPVQDGSRPATSTPTRPAGQVQQPTATMPNARPRGAVTARFLNNPPTIDGDWSEWKDITQEYPATNVVFGRENWTNEDDLAASFHVGWDNNYLYVAVKVRDDRYVQNATGENLFQGDSVEILFDRQLQEDFYYNSLSPDDFQLGISPGRPDPAGAREAYLWLPNNVAGARAGVIIASRTETGVYRTEAAIPWNVLETTPAAGTHYGFAISVSDNDETGQNVQQSMVSNITGRRLTDPTTWGDLQLVR